MQFAPEKVLRNWDELPKFFQIHQVIVIAVDREP